MSTIIAHIKMEPRLLGFSGDDSVTVTILAPSVMDIYEDKILTYRTKEGLNLSSDNLYNGLLASDINFTNLLYAKEIESTSSGFKYLIKNRDAIVSRSFQDLFDSTIRYIEEDGIGVLDKIQKLRFLIKLAESNFNYEEAVEHLLEKELTFDVEDLDDLVQDLKEKAIEKIPKYLMKDHMNKEKRGNAVLKAGYDSITSEGLADSLDDAQEEMNDD